MALTDSQSARQSATIAENAAAEAKSYSDLAQKAKDFSDEAKVSADEAAASAELAASAQADAELASNAAQTSATAAQASANSAALSANDAAIASNVYLSLSDAQTAITAGTIPLNGLFSYNSSNGNNYIDQGQNVSGVATPTGKSYPSASFVTSLSADQSHLRQSIGVMVYSKFDNINNYYVVATGVNAGQVLPTSSQPTVLNKFPVYPGQSFTISSPNFNSNYFAIALSVDGLVTSATLGLVTLSGSGSTRTFSVPAGSQARFAFMNVVISSGGFDITNTVSVVVNYVNYIGGIAIKDDYARTSLIPDSLTLVSDNSPQLYNSGSNITGSYVVATGSNQGNIGSSSGTVLTYFPVLAGGTYEVYATNFNTSYFAITLKTDNLVTGTTLGLVTLSGSGASRTFTVPSNSAATYAFMNVVIPGGSFDIRTGLVISGPTKKAKAISSFGLYDETARQLISGIQSPLRGKSWVVIGDSITEHNFRTNKNYQDYVSSNVGGMSIYNYGISGSGYYGRSDVASTVTQNPDYITVFFGTNDWGQVNNSKPLGNFLDNNTTTISGCINICLLGLITKFYNKKIAVLTPLPRANNWGSNAAPNAVGYTLEQLVFMIQKHAGHYSIPCLDLYHDSNLPVYTTDGNAFYFTYPGGSSPDGLHPNDAGHIVIAAKVQAFLESN